MAMIAVGTEMNPHVPRTVTIGGECMKEEADMQPTAIAVATIVHPVVDTRPARLTPRAALPGGDTVAVPVAVLGPLVPPAVDEDPSIGM